MSTLITSGQGSHSGFGLSYWSGFTRCARRRLLDDLSGNPESRDILTPTSVGAVFHKILELYYGRRLNEATFDNDDPNVREALRLFGGYRERFPQHEFGKVVGCEMPFMFTSPGEDPRRRIGSGPLGVSPFSGRYDMVVNLDSKALESLSGAPRYLPLMEEGIYIIDTKTMRQRGFDVESSMKRKLQFLAYMMAWDIIFAPTYGPCKGFIANCVVRHVRLHEGSFFSVYCPPPNEDDQRTVRSYLQYCYELYERYGEDHPNAGYCDSYGLCPHLTSGKCKRY